MALETSTFINGLVATNPVSTDPLAQADDHLRLIKSTITATFPAITGAVTSTHTELNILDGVTATTAELNIMDGVTATAAELNILDGCTVTAANLNALSGVTNLASATEVVNDTTPQLGGQLDTNGQSIAFGDWTIEVDGSNNLSFAYSGNVKLRITSAGALDVADDITAYSGI